MRDNGLKIAFAAGIGVAILAFFIGKHLLGPLLVPKPSVTGTGATARQTSPLGLSASAPEGIVRGDVSTVPDDTEVIVERLTRPQEEPSLQGFPFDPTVRSLPPETSTVPPTVERPLPSTEPSRQENPIPEPSPSPTVSVQPPLPPERPSVPPLPTAGERRFRVRLGVFDQEKNANELMAGLAGQGYHPFKIEEITPTGKKRYRVYIGAFDDRESAERMKKELADKDIPSVVEEVPQE